MRNRYLLPMLYALSVVSVGPAMFAKSMHTGNPLVWFTICLITQILFAIAAIAELRSLEYVSYSQKSIWSGLLLVAPVFSGLFYLKNIRRRSRLIN